MISGCDGSTVCVNLSRLRDAHIAGKALFLGVSVRVFLEGVGVPISRQSKEGHPHQYWAATSPFRSYIEQKGSGEVNSVFA